MPNAARITQIRRHGPVTRLTHWINVVAIFVLLKSGLQIFNAHPALYWGQDSHFATPWLSMFMRDLGERAIGVTQFANAEYDTTGLFGYSARHGMMEPRGFPGWATLPSWRSLADGRVWHFAFAWLFVANGLVYLGAAILGGRLRRDLLPRRGELTAAHLKAEIRSHLRLRFPRAAGYNTLQKLTYLVVILGLLPLMLATGLSMSPGMNAAAPWLIELFGGRQSARSIHFIAAGGIVLFVIVHVAMVVAAGPWNHLRAMITGQLAIEPEGERP